MTVRTVEPPGRDVLPVAVGNSSTCQTGQATAESRNIFPKEPFEKRRYLCEVFSSLVPLRFSQSGSVATRKYISASRSGLDGLAR